MLRRIVAILSTLVLAFFILSVSVLRAASVNYAFQDKTSTSSGDEASNLSGDNDAKIDYSLPYPGNILPDSPFWPLKAARDRLWLMVTFNSGKKAEILLNNADKRLASSKILFERDKSGLAFSTLSKGEKYFKESLSLTQENFKKGLNTSDFQAKLARASLKHRETIEEILKIAPEDAKPGIISLINFTKESYKISSEALLSKGLPVPESPFEGD
jgi:hypothetical protein